MTVLGSREMSETGLRWLGALPADWRRVPFWTLFRREKRVGFEDEQLLSVYRDFGVIPKASRDDNFNNASEDLGLYQLVEPGDLAINKMKAWQGSVAISDHRGIVSPAYFVFTARHTENPRFLNYLFRSPQFTAFYWSISKGIRPNQWDLEPQEHSRMLVPLPLLAEQTAITEFLDRETGKIDTLVEEQRRLIELLKEKRQAVISHAVTKGLDPDVKMKPSGVEWLGDVPEHWDVVPCGYRYEVQLGRMLNEERASGTDLRPYLRVFDVQWAQINVEDLPLMDFPLEARQRYRLAPGDLLVNEGGSYVGRSAIWRGELEECYYQKALHRLRPRDRARDTADFLLLVMEMATKVGAFVAGGNQTTIDHLTAEQLRGQRFPYPPHAEQVAIAEFVEKTIKRVEQLSQEVEIAIRLLTERRAALISAAVTGKIDVGTVSSSKSAGRERFRLVVGAEIVERLAHKKAFGRVKLQKLLYLAEVEAGISELKGEYLREAAGPLDRDLIADVEALLRENVEVEQLGGPGSPVTYRVLGAKGTHRQELSALLGDRSEILDSLIELLGDMDTLQVEAAATLYAVWNDALLDGRQPNDEEIVSGVLNDWHPEKAKKFKAEELDVRLGWMRRNHLIPSGTGPRTVTGRLFP